MSVWRPLHGTEQCAERDALDVYLASARSRLCPAKPGGELLFQGLRELPKVEAQRSHPEPQLDDVETADAGLAFADECLILFQQCGELRLAYTLRLAYRSKQMRISNMRKAL